MTVDPRLTFFFLHVMKTGGSTFRGHIDNNFGPGEVCPDPGIDQRFLAAKSDIRYLQELPADRVAKVRLFSAHVPLGLTDRLGREFIYLTILRDPVDRTISWLRQRQRNHHPDWSLEEIYDEPSILRANYIDDHQAKQFAITAEDGAVNHLHPVDMDDGRMAIARANLDRVHVVGFQDRFDGFLAELHDRYGWDIVDGVPNRNVGAGAADVSDSLRQRIDDENPFDREFYEYARRTRG